MTEYRYRIILIRKDDSIEDLGEITMISEAYGGLDETDAVSLALGELVAPNSTMFQWRGTVFLKSDLKSLKAELVQIGELPDEA